MHKEIGGYIELEKYRGKMLYEDAIKVNCGRNALHYLLITKKIHTIYIPKFMCNSNDVVLKKENVKCIYYNIDEQFHPIIEERSEDEWLYIVNYYGQLSNEYIKSLGSNIIVDNAQAYFQQPLQGYDTIYTCRKFFGVPDGALLYTDKLIEELPIDESFKRMNYLLGRFERGASEFYSEYVANNENFLGEPIKTMSKLTENLLRAIDYDYVKDVRTKNFEYLHNQLSELNRLKLTIPIGAFMYPLYINNGVAVRKKLLDIKIYVPTLWPDVFDICNENELEYNMAKDILPLPVDQRYDLEDMKFIADEVIKYIHEED